MKKKNAKEIMKKNEKKMFLYYCFKIFTYFIHFFFDLFVSNRIFGKKRKFNLKIIIKDVINVCADMLALGIKRIKVYMQTNKKFNYAMYDAFLCSSFIMLFVRLFFRTVFIVKFFGVGNILFFGIFFYISLKLELYKYVKFFFIFYLILPLVGYNFYNFTGDFIFIQDGPGTIHIVPKDEDEDEDEDDDEELIIVDVDNHSTNAWLFINDVSFFQQIFQYIFIFIIFFRLFILKHDKYFGIFRFLFFFILAGNKLYLLCFYFGFFLFFSRLCLYLADDYESFFIYAIKKLQRGQDDEIISPTGENAYILSIFILSRFQFQKKKKKCF